MTQKNVLQIFEREFKIEGVGKTLDSTLMQALGDLRKQASLAFVGSIVYMEPMEIRVLSAAACHETERFLLFFWPRKRCTYRISYSIKVCVKVVDLSEISLAQ